MNKKVLFAALAAAVIAVGCGTALQSSRVDMKQSIPLHHARDAIPYFLPRGKIHLVATRAATPLQDPSPLPVYWQAIASSHLFTNKIVQTGDLMRSNSVSVFVMYSNMLNRLKVPRYEYSVSISEVIEPDGKLMFLLHKNESAFAHDTYDLKVQNGLLQSVATTNADQTGNIIIDLAKTAAEIYKIASGGLFPSKDVSKVQAVAMDFEPDFPPVLDLTFDPTEPAEFNDASNQLARALLKLEFTGPQSVHDKHPVEVEYPSWREPGVFYRPSLPCTIVVTAGQRTLTPRMETFRNQQWNQSLNSASNQIAIILGLQAAKDFEHAVGTAAEQISRFTLLATNPPSNGGKAPEPVTEAPSGTLAGVIRKTVMLPNKAPILAYDVRRAPLVSKGTQLAFANGCLPEVHSSKPSEVLAGVKIPLTIAQTIIALPTDLIQLKINLANSNAGLINAQAAQINAQAAQLNALSNLLVAERILSDLRHRTNSAATNTP